MTGLVWSRFYLIPLFITVFNLVFAPWAFWHYEAELGTPLLASSQPGVPRPTAKTQMSNMAQAFKSKIVILGALFIFAYQGAEVSISGWVISFLITARNGNPASIGYVTSGFWSGITIGRFFLSPVAHRIGEKRFVYGMAVGSAVFELLVWQIPNVIGDAVAVSIVGLRKYGSYPRKMHC
jgi:fucose permease